MPLTLQPNEVLDTLSQALATSRDWARGRSIPNAMRSARFCSDVCGNIDDLLHDAGLKSRYISVVDEKKKRPGEWLLDGVWSEEVTPDNRMTRTVPARVRCALECESSTSRFDYFTDFAKLLAISSDIKLFLAGLKQRKKNNACRYMNIRVQQSGELVDQYDRTQPADWYLAFWPSPLAVGQTSLWDIIDDEKLTHLQTITLYRFADHGFQKISEVDSA